MSVRETSAFRGNAPLIAVQSQTSDSLFFISSGIHTFVIHLLCYFSIICLHVWTLGGQKLLQLMYSYLFTIIQQFTLYNKSIGRIAIAIQ